MTDKITREQVDKALEYIDREAVDECETHEFSDDSTADTWVQSEALEEHISTAKAYIAQQAEALRLSTERVRALEALMPEGADTCCCGDMMIGHSHPMSSGHSPKSMHDWHVECLHNRIEKLEIVIPIAIGDILYLANERNELPRFQDTIKQLEAALAAKGE